MKKLLIICGLVLGAAVFANAQQQGGRGMGNRIGVMMKPEDRVKQMDEKLKLSDDQKAKLTTLFTEQADAVKKAREDAKANAGEKRADMETMKKLREENEAKMNAILTADQQKAYKAMQDEQRAKMRERMQERRDNNN